ncbi:MAG: hypothetical protein A2351_08785 [Omnitrophica bacterium RIFOXYB12_FULL_50_7]|nr:MAG: hypothetical protein A2351_08785 [Omnitrophica bacterium RIFOXYB12_FULL_50_7]
MNTSRLAPKQFQAVYPRILEWIGRVLVGYESQARAVATTGFPRLPLYFDKDFLASAKFVVVDRVPVPPLASMGLEQFSEFEKNDYGGITYLDTFFLKQDHAADEGLYFHELIHVLQWRILGPERFLAVYADGLERFGHRNSPLEVMAYNAEAAFRRSAQPFNVEALVAEQVKQILTIT